MEFQILLKVTRKLILSIVLSCLFLFLFLISNSIAQWYWQNPRPQGNHLKSVSFPGQNTGFIAGFFGTVLKSTDGGNNWNILKTGTKANFSAAYFINNNTGFVAGNSPEDSVIIPILKRLMVEIVGNFHLLI